MSTKIRALSCSGLILAGALSAAGCYARARVEPAYVETTYVPAHVDLYPSYYYEGRTVYLIDGRWYYRQPTGTWVYYRREPPVLYRQRLTIREAPPARARPAAPTYYREAPVRHAPPAYYRDDGRRVPPPAPPPKRRHDDRNDRDRDRDGRRHDHGHEHGHDHDRGRDREHDGDRH
ncbi:MAG TPA: hypothetical protein VFZ53_19930 [Polyangiaceae bacterium]